MFKKKPTIKPFAPIRSSDRRRLATNVIKQYSLEQDTPPQSNPEETAAESSVTHLRNKLFPENTASAKFQTTQGPDLHPVNGVIYIGTHEGGLEDHVQRPLWGEHAYWDKDGWLMEEVYTLFENPTLLPMIYTHQAVLKKLKGGADLMTPGLYGPPFHPGAIKGALVAIGDYMSPTVPLVIGIAEINIANLHNVSGEKGKAVRVLHWVDDELYNLGSPGMKVPEELELPIEKPNEVDTTDEDGGVPLENVEQLQISGAKAATEEEQQEDIPEKDISTKEVDEALRDALIYSLHKTKHSSDRHANINLSLPFPLSGSYVMTELIIPHLPYHHAQLKIEKSSWKKVSKMLKVMEKEQLLKTKERGGETVIYAVNWDADKISQFKPYPLPKPKKKVVVAEGSSSSASTNTSGGKGVKIIDYFKPKTQLAPIYDAAGASAKNTYSASELSSVLTSYYTADPETSLISKTNPRLITIDPIIAHAILNPAVPQEAAILARGAVPREQLLDLFKAHHNPYHQIVRDGEDPPKPVAGMAPKITITLETRQGNKTMTKVKGIEVFGIRSEVFAEDLKKLAASSTTIQKLVGSKPADNLMEVLVQGNQEAVVHKVLESKYGISKRYTSLDNKLKKGKK